MDFGPIKDWWWVAGVIIVVIGFIARNSIKLYKDREAIKQVTINTERLTIIETQYKAINESTNELKEGIAEVNSVLTIHITDQKEDIRQILTAVYSILDILVKGGGNVDAEAVHRKLRDYSLKKV